MAYYVRKIARAKWCPLDRRAKNTLSNYKADTIANDLKTSSNTLSLWKVDSLSITDTEPIIVVNSLLGDTISKIDLLFIPESYLDQFTLEPSAGNTVVSQCVDRHYNVVSLTVRSHILFAYSVILPLLAQAAASPGNGDIVQRYTEKQQFVLLEKWLADGRLTFKDLKEKQQNDILTYRQKQANH